MTIPINREPILKRLCAAYNRQDDAEVDQARLHALYDLLTLCQLLDRARNQFDPAEYKGLARLASGLYWELELCYTTAALTPDDGCDWRSWVNAVLSQPCPAPIVQGSTTCH